MSTERFPLPRTPDGKEQWADIERRPTRDQVKAIARRTRQALAPGGEPLDAEDWTIATLCTGWQVYRDDGSEVPSPPNTKDMGAGFPAETTAALMEELNAVVASINRGGAMAQITATLDAMAWSLDDAQTSRFRELKDELHALFGVTPPNR